MYNAIGVGLIGASGVAGWSLFQTNVYTLSGFQRIYPSQFLADWGVWKVVPGPRGVWLNDYMKELLSKDQMIAPTGWKFDPSDWWLEEHGLIMEAPKFPFAAGWYLVMGR